MVEKKSNWAVAAEEEEVEEEEEGKEGEAEEPVPIPRQREQSHRACVVGDAEQTLTYIGMIKRAQFAWHSRD